MKIAHIVPSDLLYTIENRDFYMCLANIAIKNETYRNFYKEQVERGAFVLMDNGAAEADQLSLDDIYEMMKIIKPNEIILNDVIGDRAQTIINSYIALDYYKSKGYKGDFMWVWHGKNFEDWIYNGVQTELLSEIQTIGVPKTINNDWGEGFNTRLKCCKWLKKNQLDRNIHLLGCNEPLITFKKNKLTYVRSMDSCIAYLWSKADSQVIYESDRPKVTMDFYNHQLRNIHMLDMNIKSVDMNIS